MWPLIAAFAAVIAIVFFMPKPQVQSTPAPDAEAPKSGEGDEMRVLFGTRDISDPHLLWYGDVTAYAIRKKGGKK